MAQENPGGKHSRGLWFWLAVILLPMGILLLLLPFLPAKKPPGVTK